jgi:hypothetical protein
MNAEEAARTAIAHVREHYDEAIFPPRPKGPHTEVYNSEFAACARLTCDNVLAAFERFLYEEDDDDEVEVTTDMEPVPEPVAPTPIRRSGAKNLSSSHLQSAFIDEARHAMGQPSKDEVGSRIGMRVTVIFNDDHPPVTGVLMMVKHHPSAPSEITIRDDDGGSQSYPLNSIQEIRSA